VWDRLLWHIAYIVCFYYNAGNEIYIIPKHSHSFGFIFQWKVTSFVSGGPSPLVPEQLPTQNPPAKCQANLHIFIQSVTPSSTHSLTHSPIHSFICSFKCSSKKRDLCARNTFAFEILEINVSEKCAALPFPSAAAVNQAIRQSFTHSLCQLFVYVM